MRANVLIVGSEVQTAVLGRGLTSRGYEIRTARGADAAIVELHESDPALVIATLDAPARDEIEFCRRVRRLSTVPIMVVSGHPDEPSEVAALDAGADDYLGKPCSTERLLARVRVALRRKADAPEAKAFGVGVFHIDFDDRRVHVHGQPVRLTPKEFDLLVFMARHPNRVLAHRMLLGAVWGEAYAAQPEYLRVFVGQLRKKLEAEPSNPRYLVTEPWVGYRFNPDGVAQ